MATPRVLFICSLYGGRSLMAQAFVDQLAPGKIEAFSASFEAGKIGSPPIKVMQEIGIDMPRIAPKSVFERHANRERFDYVIFLCDEATSEQCPIFKAHIQTMYASKAKRMFWSIPAFTSNRGTDEEQLEAARVIRDQIQSKVIQFLGSMGIDVLIEK